jgi:hypothetical protein
LWGIDIQILGIGSDGHIAFNEPGSSLMSRTRLKTLAKSTIDDNARFFDKAADVPIYAITMGVGTILEAKQLLLVANGEQQGRRHRQGGRRSSHRHDHRQRSPTASERRRSMWTKPLPRSWRCATTTAGYRKKARSPARLTRAGARPDHPRRAAL